MLFLPEEVGEAWLEWVFLAGVIGFLVLGARGWVLGLGLEGVACGFDGFDFLPGCGYGLKEFSLLLGFVLCKALLAVFFEILEFFAFGLRLAAV